MYGGKVTLSIFMKKLVQAKYLEDFCFHKSTTLNPFCGEVLFHLVINIRRVSLKEIAVTNEAKCSLRALLISK